MCFHGLGNPVKFAWPQKITGLALMLQNYNKNQYFCTNYEFIGYFLEHHFGQSSDAHSMALTTQATQATAPLSAIFAKIQENTMLLIRFDRNV